MEKRKFWDRYYSLKQEAMEYIKGCENATFDDIAVDIDNFGNTETASLLEYKDGKFLLSSSYWYDNEWFSIDHISGADLCYIADELTPKNK